MDISLLRHMDTKRANLGITVSIISNYIDKITIEFYGYESGCVAIDIAQRQISVIYFASRCCVSPVIYYNDLLEVKPYLNCTILCKRIVIYCIVL